MALGEEIERGWREHGEKPEEIALQASNWVARAEAGEVIPLASLLLHIFTDHINDSSRAISLIERLCPTTTEERLAIARAQLVLQLVSEDSASAEDALSTLADPMSNNTHQARVLALAAGSVGARGRPSDATRWLVRAANLTHSLPDQDPAVRTVAIAGNNLACALEEKLSSGAPVDTNSEEVKLLRLAASVARVAWERAGSWLEVERAEYRLAMSSLAVGEPFGAAAHAEACRTMCEANRAPALELAFAHEALARSRQALGDSAGARASREFLKTLLPTAGTDAAQIEALLARLDPLLSI